MLWNIWMNSEPVYDLISDPDTSKQETGNIRLSERNQYTIKYMQERIKVGKRAEMKQHSYVWLPLAMSTPQSYFSVAYSSCA